MKSMSEDIQFASVFVQIMVCNSGYLTAPKSSTFQTLNH